MAMVGDSFLVIRTLLFGRAIGYLSGRLQMITTHSAARRTLGRRAA